MRIVLRIVLKWAVCALLSLVLQPIACAQTGLPLVFLSADDLSAGTQTWKNAGTLSNFTRLGDPHIVTLGGVKGVAFDGKRDAYRGPITPSELEGHAHRTIEVWVYNPTLDSAEETIVAWGRRGGLPGTASSFNWGRSTEFGAFTHWAADMGWNGVPKAGEWHLLTYTYDGITARIYDDGIEKSVRAVALNTAAGFPIMVAAQNDAQGNPQWVNEADKSQIGGSLAISSLRILPLALTPKQVIHDFATDAKRYEAVSPVSLADTGRESYTVGPLTITLFKATGAVAALSPTGSDFDFTPGDRLGKRTGAGFYHLGDLTLRTRIASGDWQSFSSAASRADPVTPVTVANMLAAADITPAMGANCPLTVVRAWVNDGSRLVLRFTLTNHSAQPVQIGALGIPMVFNNLITGRTLDEAHEKCCFATPYPGNDGGYVQVTRLNGHGPALLVLPEPGTPLEAYRPLWDDPTPRSVTFEGFYEWMARSQAYAENEWKDAAGHWNPPTSQTLAPGTSVSYGVRFALSPTIRAIEPTLIAAKRPVLVGIPGYVLPTDQTGRLFIHAPAVIQSVTVEPPDALVFTPDPKPTAHGWRAFVVRGKTPGRCRIVISYAGEIKQSAQYFVIPPEAAQVARLGAFHAAKQWFDDPHDPFGRTDSFLPYDRTHNALIVQHPHSWFVGLSDEIGAGASVAVAMKNAGQPNAREVALLEKYANSALWGHVQNPDYSIRAGLFYYDPNALPNYTYQFPGKGWTYWDKARTETTWRTYNYPHVTAVYWALYHLARDHQGLVRQQTWDWYLDHAYRTAMAIPQFASRYAKFGLMVGSVFPSLIQDLRHEGWNDKADQLEAYMKTREAYWRTLRYPFGSEMPWDSTGQEEVYTWSRYFGDDDKARETLDAITGYTPTVPNWAYNGAARRYFDAPVNGNYWPEIVQTTNHYGSSLNAIPVLDAYKRNPADLYLLRLGYAGMDQILANIDSEGFASYGFNTNPAHLDFDPYTADYGIAFFGYARNAGVYITHDPEFGWLAFGGNIQSGKSGTLTVTPHDAFRQRIFLAPLGLWLTLDAGTFRRATFDPKVKTARITFDPATPDSPTALLRLGQMPTGHLQAAYALGEKMKIVRGAFAIPLGTKPVTVLIAPK